MGRDRDGQRETDGQTGSVFYGLQMVLLTVKDPGRIWCSVRLKGPALGIGEEGNLKSFRFRYTFFTHSISEGVKTASEILTMK